MKDQANNNTRVALYARVSTEEQKEGQTIQSQIEELRRFSEQKHWQVTGLYKDEGWSGTILARPDLDRLRDDASRGLFGAVLLNDVDRLARDVTHLGVIKRDLERHGVRVIFRKLPAEASPTHNLMVNILGSFAEFEREMIVDRTRRGKRHKVEVRKKYLGSLPSYGYRYVSKDRVTGKDGYLEIVPEEATIIRKMYFWVEQEGLSARKVVSRLNQLKIPTRRGGKSWQRSSVLRILRNETYAGVWHYNKHKSCEPLDPVSTRQYKKSLKSSQRLQPRSEWIAVPLPESLQIIGRDQWQRVQRQLRRNMAFSSRNEKHVYFLKGLVRCSGCGARYVGQPCHQKFYYRCLRRCKKIPTVQEGQLNTVVWNAVEEAVLNPDLIANQAARLNEVQAKNAIKPGIELSQVQKALCQVEKEEARVIEAYRLGILSAAQLDQELEKLCLRQKTLNGDKAELSQQLQTVAIPAIRKSIRDYCNLAAKRLRSFTKEQRQRFLRLILREILFDGSTVKIRGIIPLSDNRTGKARTVVEDYRINAAGGIVPIVFYPYGHNEHEDLQGILEGLDPQEPALEVPFELTKAVPRLPHSRGFAGVS